jgi:DNA-directed RNA polymerase subunit RPC12/RpoP
VIEMGRSGTKPGKGSYICSKCGAVQDLKTGAATLKRGKECGSELFRKNRSAPSPARTTKSVTPAA